MDVAATAKHWYHKAWVHALLWIFVGLFIGAFVMGITLKQLYGAAKGKVMPSAAAVIFFATLALAA